jgi:hypothetical protein
VADVWSYGSSYLVGAGIELLALPFLLLARRERASSDRTEEETPGPEAAPVADELPVAAA